MGWNCQPTRMITFENVRIPADYLLGEEGEGFKFAMLGLDGGRINIATCSVGTAQQALNEAKQYMTERKQFGRSLAQFQALQFKLADMATELVAARQMVRLAAAKLDAQHAEKARTVPWQNALLLMWALKSAIRRCKFTVAMATSKNTQSSAISETFVFTKFWKVPTKSCV